MSRLATLALRRISRRRAVQQFRTAEQPEQRSVETTIAGVCGVFARNHYEIPTVLYMRQNLNAGGFSKSALHAVTHNGVAYPLAYREPESTMFRIRAPRREHKPSVRPAFAFAPHRREIPRLSQAMLLLHIHSRTLCTRHYCLRSEFPRQGYTVSLWRPLNMRRFNSLRPFLVLMRDRKPCTRIRRRFLG